MNTTITDKIKSDKILSTITENFDNEIWLVGGSVRDLFMCKETHDRDLVITDEDAREFSLKLAQKLDAVFVPLDEENRIYRLVMRDKINYIDITNPVGQTIEEDLTRRDLTINAVAINIKNGEIVDVTGGIDDIKQGIIRHISDKNFTDDPLRLLRVYRFQAIYGFEIAPETLEAIKKYAKLIKQPAVERINYEILRLFGGKFAHIALDDMDKSGILEEIFPFVKELKKVPPNSHHHLDLYHHCLETVKQIQNIYENSAEKVKEHLEKSDFGGHSRLSHLKMAGFMHDMGKYSTWTIEEGGRHRFIKHDDVGSKMSVKFFKSMHLSNRQIDYISKMIKFHIYPSSVMCAPEISDKIMMRYVRKMDDSSIDCIVLAQADRLSARGPEITDEIVEKNINSLNRLLKFYLDVADSLKPLPKLLNGNDVMKILDIKPSEKLGEIMDSLHEAQLSGEVNTRDEAVEFVKKIKI